MSSDQTSTFLGASNGKHVCYKYNGRPPRTTQVLMVNYHDILSFMQYNPIIKPCPETDLYTPSESGFSILRLDCQLATPQLPKRGNFMKYQANQAHLIIFTGLTGAIPAYVCWLASVFAQWFSQQLLDLYMYGIYEKNRAIFW